MIATVLSAIISVYNFILLLRVILSWFPTQGTLASVYDMAYRLTEPLLRPIRAAFLRIEFFRSVPIDFSPLVLFLLISLAQSLVYLIF